MDNTITIKGYTNHLKNGEEAVRHFCFILKQLLSYIEENGKEIIQGQCNHCHKLTGKNRNLAIKIIREIYKDSPLIDGSTDLWQLGMGTEEIRIVGSFVNWTFYPLFIDHHHLIYPDKHYNQADYKNYGYIPQEHLIK